MSVEPSKRLKVIVFTYETWNDVCPIVRLNNPLSQAGVQVIRGNDWFDGRMSLFPERIAEADLIVIQRAFPAYREQYKIVLEQARVLNKPMVYETDDSLTEVSPEHPDYSHFRSIRASILSAILDADAVTVSTPPLGDLLRQYHPHITVLPNYLDDCVWTAHLNPIPEPANESPLTIGYMGTYSHTPDLEMIEPALVRILEKYGERVQLKLWGVPPPRRLAKLKNVLFVHPGRMQYHEFIRYAQQQQAHLMIAPLRDTLFNRCKSNIKYLEYAAMGIPGVYSKVAPYEQIVKHGENGLLATSIDEWMASLEFLIQNPDARLQMARAARQTVVDGWLLSKNAHEWVDCYQEVLEGRAGRPQTIPPAAYSHMDQWYQEVAFRLNRMEAMDQMMQTVVNSETWKALKLVTKVRARAVKVGRQWLAALTRKSKKAIAKVQGHELLPPAVTETSLNSSEKYRDWIRQHETYRQYEYVELAAPNEFKSGFALIAAFSKVEHPLLERLVQSVEEQAYHHWSLILYWMGTEEEAEQIRAKLPADERISFRVVPQGDPAVMMNQAVAQTDADFFALIEPDAWLARNALEEAVFALAHDPTVDVLYSDHDYCDEKGIRSKPFFKPDWSPELLFSGNYLSHLTIFRKTIWQQMGGFTPGLADGTEWEFLLRISRQPVQVVHLAKVLYHAAESSASPVKTLPADLAARAVKNIFPAAEVQIAQLAGTPFQHITWPLEQKPLVSVIIPTRDNFERIQTCIESLILQTHYANFEILIVDTGSRNASVLSYYDLMTQRDSRIRLLKYPHRFNYSAVNNWAASQAQGEFLLLLNDDVQIIAPDWLEEMVRWAQVDGIGVVGAKLLKPDLSIQHAGVVIGLEGFAGHVFAGLSEGTPTILGYPDWYRNCTAVTGACLMISRKLFIELGGLDEKLSLNGNDVDLCLRVRQAGQRVLMNPFARLIHFEGYLKKKSRTEIPAEDFLYSFVCYFPYLRDGDPYFNPGLSYRASVPTFHSKSEKPPLIYDIQTLASLDEFDLYL